MKVSFNELQGLCVKAFSALGFAEGDAIDAANMVAWLEVHGLDGVEALSKGMAYLAMEDPKRLLSVLYQDADLTVLDAHNQTILGNASLALELGFARARARGLSITRIRHCHNRVLILGYLARLSKRGMNVTAFWRNAHDPLIEQVVGFKSGDTLPQLCIYTVEQVPEGTEPNHDITLIMANHVDLMPAMRSEFELSNQQQKSASSLIQCREKALVEGLDVEDPLWQTLKTLAAGLLVEATDSSRSGAGARDTDND